MVSEFNWVLKITNNINHSLNYSGYGWILLDHSALVPHTAHHRRIIGHSGGLDGVSSIFLIYPKEEVVGVVLTNKGNILTLAQLIAQAVENLADFL